MLLSAGCKYILTVPHALDLDAFILNIWSGSPTIHCGERADKTGFGLTTKSVPCAPGRQKLPVEASVRGSWAAD